MSVTVRLDVPKIIENSEEANRRAIFAMSNQVLADSNQLCPFGKGDLRSSAINNSDLENGVIKWDTLYAQYLYYGLLMVAPNGSAWAKTGERKHVKEPNVPLNFSLPGTGPLWFEKAKDVHLDEWNRAYKNAFREEFNK